MVEEEGKEQAGSYMRLQRVESRLGNGDYKEAELLLHGFIRKNPDNAHAKYLLGTIAGLCGEYGSAINLISQAIRKAPREPVYYNHYGNALLLSGQLDEAEKAYKYAIRLRPDYLEAYNNLGNVHFEQGNYLSAISSYKSALSINPNNFEAYYHLGNACFESGRNVYAISCYQMALSIKPEDARAHYNLGNVLKGQGCNLEALDSYRKAILSVPEFYEARWAFTVSQIPIIFKYEQDSSKCRSELSRELENLENCCNANKRDSAYRAVGSHTLFYLAYHDENNRELLARYGELCVRMMDSGLGNQQYITHKDAGRTIIKVGIASAHICDHSVWNAFVKGWVQHLDRKRFEVHIFSLGGKNDHETNWARQRSDSFQHGYSNVHQWVSSIIEKELDVLIYPEIGMNPITIKLASLRLAAVQVSSWGHPETTGLPTIDYYLSAQDLEPHNAQENYTEKLVTLPNLGCSYNPLPVKATEPDYINLGILRDSPVIICPGAPFKYNPQHDVVFTDIARRIDQCMFVFFIYKTPELSSILFQRLEHNFSYAGMEINKYVKFIPWQERASFYGLMKNACVMLDTIGFSGFNTAMQAIECGLPIVSKEGNYLRGRLASGILRRIGLKELIAHSDEEYVSLVVNLVRDSEYSNHIREIIESNKNKLFNDHCPVYYFEKFIEESVSKA